MRPGIFFAFQLGRIILCLALPACCGLGAETKSPPGLRIPAGYASLNASAAKYQIAIIDMMSYYQDVPPGIYSNIWGIFIGITNYQNKTYNNLINATRDAQELSAAFRDVCGLRNPTILLDDHARQRDVEEALRDIGKRDGPGDLFIFHFSGHGFGYKSVSQESVREVEGGLILLHDAPDPKEFPETRGVLNMLLLDKLIEAAGIDSKHKLFLLDCCFSGMATRTRSMGQTPGEANIADKLAQRANYLISAGRRDQPVLDGPGSSSAGSHGLLSGFMLQALREPWKVGLEFERLGNAELLSVKKLYLKADDEISKEARTVWESELRRLKNVPPATKTIMAPVIRNGVGTFSEVPTDTGLWRVVQQPQDDRWGTEGSVYLPVRRSRQNPSASNAVVASIVQPKTGGMSWIDTIHSQYGDNDYRESLHKLFRLVSTGVPPKSSNSETIEIEAELFRRPVVIASIEQGLDEIEQWRERTPGAQWWPLRRGGDIASTSYEIRFELINRGKRPLYYYFFTLDQNGVLQWLAPTNTSWPRQSDAEYTFGESPLPGKNGRMEIPASANSNGRNLSRGWPIEDEGVDIQFFMIASSSRWMELEVSLESASRLSYLLFTRVGKTDRRKLLNVNQFIVPAERAASAVEYSLRMPDTPRRDATAVVYRSSGSFLIHTWKLNVLGNNQLVPSIKPNEK